MRLCGWPVGGRAPGGWRLTSARFPRRLRGRAISWFAPRAPTRRSRLSAEAASRSPRKSSIIAPARIVAIGLATPRPAMSGAEPWTGSNIEGPVRRGFKFALGASPIPPVTAALRSVRMSPNRFDATITSNWSGRLTRSIHAASTRSDCVATSGYPGQSAGRRGPRRSCCTVARLTW